MAATTPSILNLNEDGSPLTYASALAIDHATEWKMANDEEMRKLVTATQTMKPIHKSHIPADRRRDVAYYNPQLKEKLRTATYPDTASTYPAIRFRNSKMHLILQADASYLSRPKARSVAGGVAYFGDSDDPTTNNGIVHAISSIIDVVVSSAGESEYTAQPSLFPERCIAPKHRCGHGLRKTSHSTARRQQTSHAMHTSGEWHRVRYKRGRLCPIKMNN
jgi:hypothetical protein